MLWHVKIQQFYFPLEPNNDSALNADAAKFWNKEGLFENFDFDTKQH